MNSNDDGEFYRLLCYNNSQYKKLTELDIVRVKVIRVKSLSKMRSVSRNKLEEYF